MIEYPKIETLYERKPDFSVDAMKVRLPEFTNIRYWHITEKVDGTNVRIGLHADGAVEYNGRTDNAQMHVELVAYLRSTFTPEKLQVAFEPKEGAWPEVVLFGEGYGSKINSGGKYRDDIAVRLFDVCVAGWWVSPENVQNIAHKLDVLTVPYLGISYILPKSELDLQILIGGGGIDHPGASWVAAYEAQNKIEAEGIVARADPMLHLRDGRRCMWKLKFSDFRKGKK